MKNRHEFDYIIVGAGSAGCVLAARLSEDKNIHVCLIEAGAKDNSIIIKMPAALTFSLESDRYNWKFESEPEAQLNGRRIAQARGRCLGGSSSINGMVFVRGDRKDYDSWRDFGVRGWDFDDCLPFFKKMENFEGGRDPLRGGSGPLTISRNQANHPLYQAFLQAGQQFGLADAGDYNSGDQEGVHITQATIRDGVRCSTSLAYLDPIKRRKNLTIMTDCLVEKIDFDGKRAIGVTLSAKGERKKIRAARETILAAGSIGSPHLLLLSGIGARAHLGKHDIPTLCHLPGCGANLQDHVVAPLRFHSRNTHSLSRQLNSPLARLKIGLEWLLCKKGLGVTNFFEVGAFFKSSQTVDYINAQHEFLPFLADFQSGKVTIADGFQYFVSQMRPHSRGCVMLKSANPAQKPAIHFNYLQDERDTQEMLHAIRRTLEMVSQSAWDPYRGEPVDTPDLKATDSDLQTWLRHVANTEHHPTSSCRMGDDDLSVVDSQGLVHEMEGLRIVDGSILPKIPTANVNAPIIMVAEKISHTIMQRHKEPQGGEPHE